MTTRHDPDALTSPTRAGALALLEPGRRASRALQAAGGLIGVALIIWAISLAFTEENAAARARLGDASAGAIAHLLGVTLFGITIVGLTFWVTLLPMRRARVVSVLTINAIAMFLIVLPFKLGFLSRVVLHHRVDGLPFRVILAWLAAVAGLGVASIGPIAVISLWRGQMDSLWWGALTGSLVVTHMAAWRISLWAQRGAVKGRLSRLLLHGDELTAQLPTVIAHGALRMIDMAQLAWRFAIASAIVQIPMGAEQAVILASTYVVLSVVAPFGALGVREWGVALVGSVVGLNAKELMLVVLAVSFSELLVAGTLGLAGSAIIHPWRRRETIPQPPQASSRD